MKKTYQRYLRGLILKEQDLADKKILDLGCGEGEFIKYLLDNGISRKAYGLALNLPKGLNGDHFFEHDFAKELPFRHLDYALSVGAVTNILYWYDEKKAREVIENILFSLSNSGELRVYPVLKNLPENRFLGIEKHRKAWLRIMASLLTKGFHSELRTVGPSAEGEWMEEVLIIRK